VRDDSEPGHTAVEGLTIATVVVGLSCSGLACFCFFAAQKWKQIQDEYLRECPTRLRRDAGHERILPIDDTPRLRHEEYDFHPDVNSFCAAQEVDAAAAHRGRSSLSRRCMVSTDAAPWLEWVQRLDRWNAWFEMPGS